ncbi:MAG: hypothetical protein M1522_05235 [Actinobacteria bacterium]|jgi:hypothetical protein|nr:hypothetical protein [Actinomycetota bacterium]
MEPRDVTEEMLLVLESGSVEEREPVATDQRATERVLMKAVGDERWVVGREMRRRVRQC